MRKKFDVWVYNEDLDAQLKDDRNADHNYCVLVRRHIESKKDLKNMSAAIVAKREDFKGITLLERLLLEIYYFNKTRGHLDSNSATLCSGSRVSGGGVPQVGSDSGEVYIDWGFPNDSRRPLYPQYHREIFEAA
jgi:hypothetical protein